MTKQSENNLNMSNNSESDSDSEIMLESTFPSNEQLEKNEYLRNVWELWNSYDHQDLPTWREMQLILKEMKKEEMEKIESDSNIVLEKTFPTTEQLEKNDYLKHVWELWNSYDGQDLSTWREMQFILKKMKKEEMEKIRNEERTNA